MPLYREWESDPFSLAAIWQIAEPLSFFRAHTVVDLSKIKNEKKQLEHIAGRYLLQFLKKDFPLHHIQSDEHDKPRLPNNKYFFSISHSFPYVAAVISPYKECGIDIQCWHTNIKRIQHKFLSLAEQKIIGTDDKMITAAWSAKEAAYKWNGRRGVDFIEHLPIIRKMPVDPRNPERLFACQIENLINPDSDLLPVICQIDPDFSTAVVCNQMI